MACPLRKCKTDGGAYTRPPEIEAAIDEALALDATTRLARTEILDRKAPGFLPKEALVYLIRDAKRVDDPTTLSKLFTILERRCEAVLAHQVPDTYPNAVDIRADALSKLSCHPRARRSARGEVSCGVADGRHLRRSGDLGPTRSGGSSPSR